MSWSQRWSPHCQRCLIAASILSKKNWGSSAVAYRNKWFSSTCTKRCTVLSTRSRVRFHSYTFVNIHNRFLMLCNWLQHTQQIELNWIWIYLLSSIVAWTKSLASSGRSLWIISIEELQEVRDLVLKLEMVISIPLGSQQKLACCPSCSVSLWHNPAELLLKSSSCTVPLVGWYGKDVS
jgi:hypothetical protein